MGLVLIIILKELKSELEELDVLSCMNTTIETSKSFYVKQGKVIKLLKSLGISENSAISIVKNENDRKRLTRLLTKMLIEEEKEGKYEYFK